MLIYDGVQHVDFSVIEREYQTSNDVFADDPPVIKHLNQLPEEDRKLLILYAETGSMRKVAPYYSKGKSTIDRRIEVIKKLMWNKICSQSN